MLWWCSDVTVLANSKEWDDNERQEDDEYYAVVLSVDGENFEVQDIEEAAEPETIPANRYIFL